MDAEIRHASGVRVKRSGGWYLPDQDEHFPVMLAMRNEEIEGRLAYQHDVLARALHFTKRRRVAVDVGAHCGLISFYLASQFKRIEAFEPVPEHCDCFERNVTAGNVTLHRVALGPTVGMVGMQTHPENSGKAFVSGAGDVPMIALDDMLLDKVDFLKIDVEGGETQVISGAAETIQRCRPVIWFEAKGHHERYGDAESSALDALLAMGMRVRDRIRGEIVMTWTKPPK